MIENSEIFSELDELLEKAGGKFGPLLLDELQSRLNKTIESFDSEVKKMLDASFGAYHLRMKQFQLVKQTGFTIEANKEVKESTDENDIPRFIKKIEEKQSN
jgi:hypothetical protein